MKEKGLSLEKPTVLSCNSGMTASVLYHMLSVMGMENKLALYDGSWTEWVRFHENPVEKGDQPSV